MNSNNVSAVSSADLFDDLYGYHVKFMGRKVQNSFVFSAHMPRRYSSFRHFIFSVGSVESKRNSSTTVNRCRTTDQEII